ncbi:MAG: hypothetical protein U1E54_03860 [Candidatus Levybacteria bacterium]|nr:hypothetical protein [Candidatus Levybacteria bacterium]
MKAFIFSVGEPTTDVAVWSLKRLGFDVTLMHNPKTSFYEKYREFLEKARQEDVVIRSDADVIVNKGFMELLKIYESQNNVWWMQGKLFCHLKHDLIYGAPNIMNYKAINVGLQHFHEYKREHRPETALSRANELANPRRFRAVDYFVGMHGYKQKREDIDRVLKQKEERNQLKNWDMELVEKLNAL